MYLPRAIDPILLDWSRGKDRKPLVLRGARQTGKTAAVRQLGKRFDLFIELNLERFEDLAMVRECRSADELLAAISGRHNLAAFPRESCSCVSGGVFGINAARTASEVELSIRTRL